MSVRLGVGTGPFYASSSPTGCLGLIGALILLPFMLAYWTLKLLFKTMNLTYTIGVELYKAGKHVYKFIQRKIEARKRL